MTAQSDKLISRLRGTCYTLCAVIVVAILALVVILAIRVERRMEDALRRQHQQMEEIDRLSGVAILRADTPEFSAATRPLAFVNVSSERNDTHRVSDRDSNVRRSIDTGRSSSDRDVNDVSR